MTQAASVSVSEGTKLRTEEIEGETDLMSETAQTAVANLVVGGESNEEAVIEAGTYLQLKHRIASVSLLAETCRDRGGSRERPKRGDVESEVMSLETGEIAYLLGRNGATKQRLASFSGARLEIDPQGGVKNICGPHLHPTTKCSNSVHCFRTTGMLLHYPPSSVIFSPSAMQLSFLLLCILHPIAGDGGRIEVIGTLSERELARLCVDITLQQRNNGKVAFPTRPPSTPSPPSPSPPGRRHDIRCAGPFEPA